MQTPRSAQPPVLGFDLCQDWQEVIEISLTGALDEFSRKKIRSDYAQLTLWDMGVKQLRVSPSDIAKPLFRSSIKDLIQLDFQFKLSSHAGDANSLEELTLKDLPLTSALEVSGPLRECVAWYEALKEIENTRGIKVYLSPQKRKVAIIHSGETFYHVINHGFTISDFKGGIKRD